MHLARLVLRAAYAHIHIALPLVVVFYNITISFCIIIEIITPTIIITCNIISNNILK